MVSAKISAAIFGGSGRGRPAEQGFTLIYFFLESCHSLKIGLNELVKVSLNCGWVGRIRTCECWDQNPVPYHLATTQYHRLRTKIIIPHARFN